MGFAASPGLGAPSRLRKMYRERSPFLVQYSPLQTFSFAELPAAFGVRSCASAKRAEEIAARPVASAGAACVRRARREIVFFIRSLTYCNQIMQKYVATFHCHDLLPSRLYL